MALPDELRLALIGAGEVNFGGGEGPWDHASRLQELPGLRVVAVVDPDLARARARIAERRHPLFAGARAYASVDAMLAETRPDAAWIGVPPHAHGGCEERLAAAGVHCFIEKPLGRDLTTPQAVAEALRQGGVLASVGYMFRYHPAVERVRGLLAETGVRPVAYHARFCCAYEEIRKADWWDVRRTGGVLVEQATHLVDLGRFLLGEADPDSARTTVLPADAPAATLSRRPTDAAGRALEEDVPVQARVPRVSCCQWRFTGGAVGTLQHGALLHGRRYECAVELWGDGLRILLEDPYGECRLSVRRPGTEGSEPLVVPAGDPYLAEDAAFLDAVRRGDPAPIRSPYLDALRSHQLAWALARAAG